MRRRVMAEVALLAGCSVALVALVHADRPSIVLPAETSHVPAWPAASPDAAAAAHAGLAAHDRDRDGVLSRDEYRAAARAGFARLDLDRDRRLDLAEWADPQFDAADHDRSGTIDADEFGRGPDGRRDAVRRADDRWLDPPQGLSLG
jgi:hypothetical protein